jgi:CRISPR-associated protein Csb2
MLTVSVELLHGTLRATGYEDTAITGGSGPGEWPASPARIFSALVAADGTRKRQHLTDGTELRLLERARPPRILADPLARVLTSNLHQRFVVADQTHIDNKTRATGSVQEYPGRTNTVVRPGTRMAPESPRVTYVWDDIADNSTILPALAVRAARTGYLGCADSPVRVYVGNTLPEGDNWWVPSSTGSVILPVPYEGFLQHLDAAFDAFSNGEAPRRAWVPNRYQLYQPPGVQNLSEPQPTAIWARFDRPVSGRHVLRVTETLRRALLELYGRHVASSPEEVPSVLSGHGFATSGYHHAVFLALPDVGHRYARGLLHGAAVVLPPGTPADVVEGVRNCLWQLRVLKCPQVFETGVRLHGGEPRPSAAVPERWLGPSRRWVSATPVVHERYQRHGPTLEEVARWCEHAGVTLARPIFCRALKVPLAEGAPSLSPTEVYREGKPRRPYSHLEVVFDQPVSGPVVLGRARQFGLGLMCPFTRGEDASG